MEEEVILSNGEHRNGKISYTITYNDGLVDLLIDTIVNIFSNPPKK